MGLGLPALLAALPLAAVIFQRDDDREERRNCRGFCLIVQHPATISSKAISAVQFIPPHGKFLDRGEWKDESRGPCLAGTSPGMAGLRTLCGCTSCHPSRLPIRRRKVLESGDLQSIAIFG